VCVRQNALAINRVNNKDNSVLNTYGWCTVKWSIIIEKCCTPSFLPGRNNVCLEHYSGILRFPAAPYWCYGALRLEKVAVCADGDDESISRSAALEIKAHKYPFWRAPPAPSPITIIILRFAILVFLRA